MSSELDECREKLEILFASKSYDAMIPILNKVNVLTVSKEDIQKTKIGVLLNKIRKSESADKKSTKIATDILLKWKKILLSDGPTAESVSKKEPTGSPSTVSTNRPTSPSVIVSLADNLLFEKYKTDDPVRNKCIEMFVTALTTENPEMAMNPDELVIETAQAVEAALFAEFSSTSSAYKAKFRSKYLNLKDKSNPLLRQSLLDSTLSPERFNAMTTAEMASEERRKEDLALQEVNLSNTKAVQDTQAETDQFKCGRCGKRKCKYYQLQTRSADEPMTTFVTCINCNNRWKFC